ncbi:MAG TPA: hypothetical protein VJA25_02020 [Dehalococcoidia bacterium]|nr:hypothetical protein [Dehalococcoidia bacterium]
MNMNIPECPYKPITDPVELKKRLREARREDVVLQVLWWLMSPIIVVVFVLTAVLISAFSLGKARGSARRAWRFPFRVYSSAAWRIYRAHGQYRAHFYYWWEE